MFGIMIGLFYFMRVFNIWFERVYVYVYFFWVGRKYVKKISFNNSNIFKLILVFLVVIRIIYGCLKYIYI